MIIPYIEASGRPPSSPSARWRDDYDTAGMGCRLLGSDIGGLETGFHCRYVSVLSRYWRNRSSCAKVHARPRKIVARRRDARARSKGTNGDDDPSQPLRWIDDAAISVFLPVYWPRLFAFPMAARRQNGCALAMALIHQ